MKSAIFQDHVRPKKPPKRLHQSPRTPSTPVPLKWNLDDMVAAYTASGALPALLSPTLPPRFASIAPEEQPKPPAADLDAVPLSLLSPTLPGVFSSELPPKSSELPPKNPETISKSTLAHPLPKRAESARPVAPGDLSSPAPTNSAKVRWALRPSDTRPRLVLRINFRSSLSKFQDTFRGRRSPLKTRGLAIFSEPAKNPWAKTAKDVHTHCESVLRSDPLFAFVLQLDWLLCSAISTDVDVGASSESVRSQWLHLHAQIPTFVHQLERFIKGSGFSDKKKSYLSFLVAILAAIKAMLLKRVNQKLSAELESEVVDRIAVQKQIIDNYRKMEDHFAESQSFFSNSPSPSSIYPKAWHNRAFSMVKPSNSPLSPTSDKYFLPLGPYSDLKEACAYLLGCLKEFTDAFASDMNGGARYTLQSQKRQSE